VGGLTDAFEDRFFEILFGGNVIVNGQPDFPAIMNELYLIPRAKGSCDAVLFRLETCLHPSGK